MRIRERKRLGGHAGNGAGLDGDIRMPSQRQQRIEMRCCSGEFLKRADSQMIDHEAQSRVRRGDTTHPFQQHRRHAKRNGNGPVCLASK